MKLIGQELSNETKSRETNLSETETTYFDEDETNNNNPQQPLVAVGKIIQNNRGVVQKLISDLLLNDPEQALIVAKSLNHG
ncbi:hypothetical protein JNUCC76_04980 [Leuconostoc sp. JNUCC 76]